jgi:hypothetical protein
VNTWEAVEIRDHHPLSRIEYNELIRAHVRDVQPPLRLIQALVIEADCRPGQRKIGYLLERRLVRSVGSDIGSDRRWDQTDQKD